MTTGGKNLLDSTIEGTVTSLNAAILNKKIAFTLRERERCTSDHGMQQALAHAKMLDAPFALSTNGDSFFLHESSPDNAEIA